jgi:hypothetical protein
MPSDEPPEPQASAAGGRARPPRVALLFGWVLACLLLYTLVTRLVAWIEPTLADAAWERYFKFGMGFLLFTGILVLYWRRPNKPQRGQAAGRKTGHGDG